MLRQPVPVRAAHQAPACGGRLAARPGAGRGGHGIPPGGSLPLAWLHGTHRPNEQISGGGRCPARAACSALVSTTYETVSSRSPVGPGMPAPVAAVSLLQRGVRQCQGALRAADQVRPPAQPYQRIGPRPTTQARCYRGGRMQAGADLARGEAGGGTLEHLGARSRRAPAVSPAGSGGLPVVRASIAAPSWYPACARRATSLAAALAWSAAAVTAGYSRRALNGSVRAAGSGPARRCRAAPRSTSPFVHADGGADVLPDGPPPAEQPRRGLGRFQA